MTDNREDVRDVDSLRAAIAAGGRFKYLFFWGHTAADGNAIGKECLSQWYSAAFDVDGVRYASAEHFMMAQKARLFGDTETGGRILATNHPGDAKRLGREVRGFDGGSFLVARAEPAGVRAHGDARDPPGALSCPPVRESGRKKDRPSR